jgi:hypothetical protein
MNQYHPKIMSPKCNPILKPSKNGHDIIDVQEETLLYVGLLEKVFKAPIFIVKSIHQTCRLLFSRSLKKVVVEPSFVGA